jgi:hypothetical protein
MESFGSKNEGQWLQKSQVARQMTMRLDEGATMLISTPFANEEICIS